MARSSTPSAPPVFDPPTGPESFDLGPGILRVAHAEPYDANDEDLPNEDYGRAVRRLTVYTQDPATPRMDVATTELSIPYEPLRPGPEGRLLVVVDDDETTARTYPPIDLDALGPAYPTGLRPSTTNPRFAQQMTYAVAMHTYETFRQALGRTPDFGFDADAGPGEEPRLRLRIEPHFRLEANAYYDPDRGALRFGYTHAGEQASGFDQPGGIIFTALSHDVIAHEMTHALLDGLRAQFLVPSNPDVLAFHEAFADLVALFQRFGHRELVARGIDHSPHQDLSSGLLTDIARQFGRATGDGRNPLRTTLLAAGDLDQPVPEEHRYHRDREAHDLGSVLVAAVFDAFRWIFQQKTAPLRRLAALAQPLARSAELTTLLASAAERLAGQFLNIVIRAIDYCPPVDLTFGEYLRALVTADYDTVPEDPWGYREGLVRSFRRYGILVDGVPDLSEDALLWRAPHRRLDRIPGLSFAELRHGTEPGKPAPREEYLRRAACLGRFVTQRLHQDCFGLLAPRAGSEPISRPVVESIRTLRRIGPDGTLNFDLVAEVTQRRQLASGAWLCGGSTVIIDSHGRVRYAITKNLASLRREQSLTDYLDRAPPLRTLLAGDGSSKGLLLRRLEQRVSVSG